MKNMLTTFNFKLKPLVQCHHNKDVISIYTDEQYISLNKKQPFAMFVEDNVINFKLGERKTILKLTFSHELLAKQAARQLSRQLSHGSGLGVLKKGVLFGAAGFVLYILGGAAWKVMNVMDADVTTASGWVEDTTDAQRGLPDVTPQLESGITPLPSSDSSLERYLSDGNGESEANRELTSLDDLLGASPSPAEQRPLGIEPSWMSDPVARAVYEGGLSMAKTEPYPANTTAFDSDLSGFGLSSTAASCEPSLAFN